MTPHTAYCSYQPEAMATVLAQTSFAAHLQLHFIIDNTSAMADLTNRASKPNRSAGRLIQKLHQRAEAQFRLHWPSLHDHSRATATHQKSHTKHKTLPAFLNRCIDVLLTHSPLNKFEPQPDLTGEENPEGYILRQSPTSTSTGQHIFGDRRHAIYNQYIHRMRNEHTTSESQGIVKKCDPRQFDEMAQIARKLGEKNPTLPATFIATTCNNLQGFYTYPEAQQQPCRMCQAKDGTSASHFLSCPMLEQTRKPFMLEIAEHFVKLSQRPRLTTEHILKSLFPLDEATNRQNPFPHTNTEVDDDITLPDYEDIRNQEEDNPEAETSTQPQHAQQHQQPTHQQQQQQTPPHTRTCVTTTKRHHETETLPTLTSPPSHKHPRLGETQTQSNPDPAPKRYREPQSATCTPNKFPRTCDRTQTNTLAHIPRPEVTTTAAKRPAIEHTAQPEKRHHTEPPSHKPTQTSQEGKHEEKPKETQTKNSPDRRSKRLAENASKTTKRSKTDPLDTPVPKNEQNARVTAMLMGIFTISTLAFIHKLIPDNSKAKKFIHATRAALAQCTHSMWKSYRHFVVTANVDSARHSVRKTKKRYYWNRNPPLTTLPKPTKPTTTTPQRRKQPRTPLDQEKPQRPKRHAPDPGLSPAYIERMNRLNEQLLAGGEASLDASPPMSGV